MRHSCFLSAAALSGLASLAGAQTHHANFDTLTEGAIAPVYVEDGITFSDLDCRLGSPTYSFLCEDASATLAGAAGFTSPNCLAWTGYSPGTGAAFSRCGEFKMTPTEVCTQASLELFVAGSSSAGNTVTLEATLAGTVVATDVFVVPSAFGPHHVQLAVGGADFDQLRVVGAGAANSGCFFALVDSVVVAGAGTGGGVTAYCFGDGTGSICPCGNVGGSEEGCANSTGSGAELGASGSTSLATNNLVLEVQAMPASQPVLLFAGANQVPQATGLGALFGDGLRCAGGAVKRFGVHAANASGEASWGGGLLGAAGWSAGETHYFQAWYRDPAGPCGSGFNLSNGLAVTVQS